MRYLTLLISLLALSIGCASHATKSSDNDIDNDADTIATRRFVPSEITLQDIKTRDQLDDYIAHYWDTFPFAEGESIEEYNTNDIYAAFAQYVLIIPRSEADSLLRHLMLRAEASREALDLFAEVAHDVLYDPNAPTRNDEYYIPVLETLVESELLDEYDKIVPQRELHIVYQNRLGHIANDFTMTLADDTHLTLHSLKADYTILLFNNPGCEMCREIIDGIEGSELIKSLSRDHNIKIVALYPDEDITAWRDYLPTMPQSWICGYDKELRLTSERLYDLKAIPSLYLLDRNKRVIIKDGSSLKQLEEALMLLTKK